MRSIDGDALLLASQTKLAGGRRRQEEGTSSDDGRRTVLVLPMLRPSPAGAGSPSTFALTRARGFLLRLRLPMSSSIEEHHLLERGVQRNSGRETLAMLERSAVKVARCLLRGKEPRGSRPTRRPPWIQCLLSGPDTIGGFYNGELRQQTHLLRCYAVRGEARS